jgi:hypothetical protein
MTRFTEGGNVAPKKKMSIKAKRKTTKTVLPFSGPSCDPKKAKAKKKK